MTGIGSFQRQPLRIEREDRFENLRKIDVMRMGAFVIAPADVDSHFVGWNARQRVIERFDVKLRALEELSLGQILKRGMT